MVLSSVGHIFMSEKAISQGKVSFFPPSVIYTFQAKKVSLITLELHLSELKE